ncbi:MAG: tRNA (adenosine(37)-N6)-threonylcarbamoyltransferase complex dimerization subunit type 1 TsaB [Clostridia bacterium]|nr:tRNA (adenosine(37)-N6)-threonylcarbamoyltransferase complex dimerization subunit type 1 TsaB [Clostridia bacterium]
MLVLGIDTSSSSASVALLDDGQLLGEVLVNSTKTHSQKLLPIIDQLLCNCDVKVKDLDLIGVATGPGSFTGVRIGLSTAKGLAHPFNIPLVEVSTLEAMGYNLVFADTLVCPIFDARRDQVYTRVMAWEQGLLKTIIADENCLIDELMDQLEALARPVTFIGDGVLKFETRLKERLGERAIMAPQNTRMPRGSSVAQCAFDKPENARRKYDDVKANYLRKSEAERTYEENQQAGQGAELSEKE